MMGLNEWLALLVGVFQFPGQLLALIKILKKTPEAKHEELIKKLADEATQYEETGRPTW